MFAKLRKHLEKERKCHLKSLYHLLVLNWAELGKERWRQGLDTAVDLMVLSRGQNLIR